MTDKPTTVRRRAWPAWVRYVSFTLAYLLWPPFKVLEKTGLLTRLMGRALTRWRLRNESGYEPKPGDVFVCAGFKSGTNWTMQIAVQIAYRGHAEFEHIHDLVPWLELPARTRFAIDVNDDESRQESPTGLRIIKTHLPMTELPYSDAARYICVVRDPKDVLVSSYFFIRSLAGPLMPSLETWLDATVSARGAEGGWADHLNSYWQMRDRQNVLFLTYEEMKDDLSKAVDKISAFLGVDLGAKEHAAVVERASFGYMKRTGHKFDPIGLGFPGVRTTGVMVRRGERGKSDELLSAEDRKRVDEFWRGELRRLGCDFPYDRAFG